MKYYITQHEGSKEYHLIEQHNWQNIFDYTQITNKIPGFNLDFKEIDHAIQKYKNNKIYMFTASFNMTCTVETILMTNKFFSDVYNKKAIDRDLYTKECGKLLARNTLHRYSIKYFNDWLEELLTILTKTD